MQNLGWQTYDESVLPTHVFLLRNEHTSVRIKSLPFGPDDPPFRADRESSQDRHLLDRPPDELARARRQADERVVRLCLVEREVRFGLGEGDAGADGGSGGGAVESLVSKEANACKGQRKQRQERFPSSSG